ncbi:MAG: hypothetical protein FWE86_01900 [Oscillospiraceae bacterium]|nr:hypothetical protein [Oscillospiraceae bacterium]
MKLNGLNRIGAGLFTAYAFICAIFVSLVTFANLQAATVTEFSGWIGYARWLVVPAYLLIACTSNKQIRTVSIVSALATALAFAYDSLGGELSRVGLPVIMPLAFVFMVLCVSEMKGSAKFLGGFSAATIFIVWMLEVSADFQFVKDIAPAVLAPHMDEIHIWAAPVMWLVIAITGATACFGSKGD